MAEGVTLPYLRHKLKRPDGRMVDVETIISPIKPLGNKSVQIIGRDISLQRRLEEEQALTVTFLKEINSAFDKEDLVRKVINLFRDWSGCKAVGIRLWENEDFPYFQTAGFPEDFVEKEKYLCARDHNYEIIRDSQGNPYLECMCGNVIMGRTDPKLPFFTKFGSFWTNSTTELLSNTTEEDRQARTRNRCHGEGYESVALIPLKYKSVPLGLIQLNDINKDKFSLDRIEMIERQAEYLAIALSQYKAREEQLKSQQDYQRIFDMSPTAMLEVNLSRLLEHLESLDLADYDHIREMLKSNPESSLECLKMGEVNKINHAAKSLFGVNYPEELVGNVDKIFDINGISPICNSILDLFEGASQVEFEGNISSINGENRNILARLSVLPYYEKNYSRVLASIVDITEKRIAEEEQARAEKLESIGILAGGIAHDFNNIMMGILGNISLARQEIDKSNEIYERLIDAEKSVVRAQDLTHQLLTFSRGGAPVKKAVDVSSIVKDSALFALHGSNVGCNFDFAENPYTAEIDARQISLVIQNLVINAIQAMPDGGEIVIKLSNIIKNSRPSFFNKNAHFIKISITDKGIGIPEKYINKIFDPYFSTKQKSSGLGLTTAYAIVNKHGGTIKVQSELDKGTNFDIYLPATGIKIISSKETDAVDWHKGEGIILVMDDEKSILKVAEIALRKLGYTPILAHHGAEAVELCGKQKENGQSIAAAILDLTVPGGMGGLEALLKLKEIEPDIKVIVSSGYSNNPVISEYKKHGFDDYVTKPYRVQELAKVLKKVIKK